MALWAWSALLSLETFVNGQNTIVILSFSDGVGDLSLQLNYIGNQTAASIGLTPSEINQYAYTFDRLSLEPDFRTEYNQVWTQVNHTNPTKDPSIMLLQYSGQVRVPCVDLCSRVDTQIIYLATMVRLLVHSG